MQLRWLVREEAVFGQVLRHQTCLGVTLQQEVKLCMATMLSPALPTLIQKCK